MSQEGIRKISQTHWIKPIIWQVETSRKDVDGERAKLNRNGKSKKGPDDFFRFLEATQSDVQNIHCRNSLEGVKQKCDQICRLK